MDGVQACFEGYLARDAEVRYTKDGKPMVSFGVGVKKQRKGQEPVTNWVNATWFGEEHLDDATQLTKGMNVWVIGELQIPARTYEGKDGTTRTSTDVTVRKLVYLGIEAHVQRPTKAQPTGPQQSMSTSWDDSDTDVPF